MAWRASASPVPRLEDNRDPRGKGEFVADIRLAGMGNLALVRGPAAHARIRGGSAPRWGSIADGEMGLDRFPGTAVDRQNVLWAG
jgi:CO/xanthine dehydrogenase Mo-binding subunit